MDGLLLVNKPKGITSHDAVMQVRRKLNTKKVGHTGTLDPMAEGLMILTIGKATKILPYIVDHRKEYIATVQFGYSTDSEDVTGNIVEEREVAAFSKEQAEEVLKSMLGDQQQIPPMYSAKKVNGQKLVDLARKNIEIERKPCDITIFEMELLAFSNDEITYRVVCSSGTYVRTLCVEIAEKLNNLGCMKALKRCSIDKFSLENAMELDDITIENVELVSVKDALSDYPLLTYEPLSDVYNGKKISLDCDKPLVFIFDQYEVIAAYEKQEDGFYYCRRGLW